jgi:hypothetical protein
MDIRKELQQKLGEHDPNDVDELILDDLFDPIGHFTESHKKAFEAYDGLVHISFNGLGIKSLNNFPKLPNLTYLELRDNELTGIDFKSLVQLYQKLEKLKLGKNPLKSFEVLSDLKGLKLRKIELEECVDANPKGYQDKLFSMFPTLEAVNNIDKEGEDVDSTMIDEGEDFGLDEEDELDDENDNELDDELDDEDEFDDEDDDDEDEFEDESEEEEPKKKGKK